MYKALVVGINKYPTAPLQGCVNDANDVIDYLLTNKLCKEAEIYPLYDERATKDAIVGALRDMIAGSSPGDNLLFHYSGHGARVPSQTASDGYEEVLCPVDFTYSDSSTWLTDSEFLAITNTVPSQTALTVVTDACHSAGLTRTQPVTLPAEVARCFPPPSDVAFRLRARKRLVRPRELTGANAILIAACQANETAADTSFGGRPNGAFTYFWLKTLAATPNASIDDVVKAVTGSLSQFAMHPADDGPTQLETSTFLITPPPVPRDFGLPPIIKRSEIVWEQAWTTKVLGMDLGFDVSISIEDTGFELDLCCNSFKWPIPISGNMSQSFDLAMGFRIVLQISDWTARSGSITFDLGIGIAPPFFAPINVVNTPVTIPVAPTARSLAAPASAAELMALIELAELARPPQPRLPSPPPVPRDADQWTGIATMEPYSGGLFGTRYEKNVNAYVPPGFIRDHIEVTLDPPNSGNVYFLDWEDSDPHIGRFRFHVGCASCQGGTATFYMHCVRDPNVIIPAARTAEQPRAVTSSSSASDESTTTAPRRSVNGTANGKNAELTGPVGGSPA